MNDTAEEFRCPLCGNQCTRTPGGLELGHERGRGGTGAEERCPRRPETVDPDGPAPDHDGWCTPGGESA